MRILVLEVVLKKVLVVTHTLPPAVRPLTGLATVTSLVLSMETAVRTLKNWDASVSTKIIDGNNLALI